MTSGAQNRVTWTPPPGSQRDSAMGRFLEARRTGGAELPPVDDAMAFTALHQWSIDNPERFWSAVWHECGVIGDPGATVLRRGDLMAPPGAVGPHWFPDAHLNFAENLLQHRGGTPAIIAWNELGAQHSLTFDQLRQAVSQVVAALRVSGVGPGDCVAGWLPNIPEAVIAMLATAAVGATWTSCSPDFGVDGIVDRFGQTRPKVLIYCDGYRYGGRDHDCVARGDELLARLPSIRRAVVIKYRRSTLTPHDHRVVSWAAWCAAQTAAPLSWQRFPFDHPLYVVYSSGTTGLPKCLVHGAGGTLLQHLKEHQLHVDLKPGERLFYFTTCGWMMWNWLVTGLASGATIMLYDGAPMPHEEPGLLWRMVAESGVHVFGTSAKYLALAEKERLVPKTSGDLTHLRTVLSTGSPLLPESFDWCERVLGSQVQLASISGGTDIVSCFVLGNPLQPVHRGEIQGPGLGMAVEVFETNGQQAPVGTAGELVCTHPFPSMPVRFGDDADGQRYRDAYFGRFPNVWHHGDWATRTPSGGFVISGRSDATLNPGGVRIGTAEVYRQVEGITEVVESLVIGQRLPGAADGDVRVVLFVRLRDGVELTPGLEQEIRKRIRTGASPHHVPRVIVAVPDLPRTRSGKLSELAVRDVVEGREVANREALANPEALTWFRDRPELK